jgi:luciferase family oxidoreductase group 1
MTFRLSILDQSTIASGRGADQAIRETLALARLAEDWGYDRYWLAEHHNSGSHAGSAPEMLVAAIAATTRRIRVGTAGIMLPHYSALKVAEQFKVAEAIAPGRIDLGLGRAPGSDGRTAFALNPNAREAADKFPNQVMDLLGWLGDGLPEGHPFRQVTANPLVPTRPEVWILGSSDYGAQVAAYFGLPYCFAHFIGEHGSEQVMQIYREGFRPHPETPGRLAAPQAALAVFALTASTEAEAWRLYKSRELWRLFRDTGRFPALPSVEEAEAYPFTEAERAHLAPIRARALVGAPEQVAGRLAALAAAHGAAEVAVLTPCHDPAARQASYRLLAEAFGVQAAPRLAAE